MVMPSIFQILVKKNVKQKLITHGFTFSNQRNKAVWLEKPNKYVSSTNALAGSNALTKAHNMLAFLSVISQPFKKTGKTEKKLPVRNQAKRVLYMFKSRLEKQHRSDV